MRVDRETKSASEGTVATLTARLEQSEARFRDVIERNADAIVVVDLEGIVRFANAAAEQLFGTTREDLLGTDFGFPLVVGETTELDLLRRDGPPLVAEMRVVRSEWAGTPAWIASMRDVTKRAEAEQNARRLIREQAARSAAERAVERLRFLADSSAALSSSLDHGHTLSALAKLCASHLADWAVVYIVDEQGQVGRLEVAHRDPAMEQVARSIRDHPIEPDGRHPVHEVLRTGKTIVRRIGDDADLRSIAQDERHLELLRELGVASYVLLPLLARGHPVGGLALVSGDRDRRFDDEEVALAEDLASHAALAVDNARLYREAREADASKMQLLAVISHDLRTPLSSIIGYADLLSMGVPEPIPEASLHHVDRIRTGTRHLLYLIEELLAFARLGAGDGGLDLRDVSASEVAREVADVMEPLAAERGIAFHIDIPNDRVTLRTDPGKLRQVLVNLTSNALKFTDEGEVRLEAAAMDGTVAFCVRDSGIGIGPDHLEDIFKPFWQVPETRRSGEGGAGLGLSVVQKLVAMLGGEVSVESVPGDGSVFTVRLPRYPLGAGK